MKQAPGPGSLGSLPNQRKAGYGLQRIPKTIYEWRDDVERYGLSNRTLSNICLQGPFSASNVPATSFLTVRAVWPGRKPVEAALPALVTEGALCETDTKCAYHLLHGGALGLDKLEALMDLICTQARPSTPVRTIGSLADQLGPFAQLVSLHNLLVRRLPSLQQQQRKDSPRLFDAPRAPMDRRQGGDEGARTSPLVDLVHRRTDRADRRADGKGDNEKKLAVTHPGRNLTMTPSPTSLVSDSTCDNGDGQGNSELLIADNDDDGAAVADLPLPTPRNPTETVVVDFLVTFIAAIATLIQPPTRIPVCVADAFEQTLQFGPVPGTNKAAEAFRASTDGGIPLGSGKSMLPAIIFEAKSAKRGDNEVSVRAQQTMEHAAFIWEKAEESRKNAKQYERRNDLHHTLMIAQDADEVFISIGSYTEAYLKYLFNPAPAAVLPPVAVADDVAAAAAHMLRIQEFSPFKISTRDHLRLLAHVILSLLVKELVTLRAGTMIRPVWLEIDSSEDESDG